MIQNIYYDTLFVKSSKALCSFFHIHLSIHRIYVRLHIDWLVFFLPCLAVMFTDFTHQVQTIDQMYTPHTYTHMYLLEIDHHYFRVRVRIRVYTFFFHLLVLCTSSKSE